MRMRNLFAMTLTLGIMCALFMAETTYAAYATKSVSLSATVAVTADWSVVARNWADDSIATDGVVFGTMGSTWTAAADQYIAVTVVTDTWWNWAIEAYTDNFAGVAVISTGTWGGSYGALVDTSTITIGRKIPLCWSIRQAKTVLPSLPVPGDMPTGAVYGSTWTYMLDKSDYSGDVNFSSNVALGKGAGWVQSEADGYPTIMYGNQSSATIIRPDYHKDNAQQPVPYGQSVAVMINGLFPAPAGTYKSQLYFDLIHK